MIARPNISRNERKTTERGAFEVGNFAPFCCPGFGATLNLFGMALTLISAEQVVGMLIAKALVAPGALTNIVSAGGAIAAPSIPAVTALDVFVVQANTNTLCAHFASLLATLGLLSRSDKW